MSVQPEFISVRHLKVLQDLCVLPHTEKQQQMPRNRLGREHGDECIVCLIVDQQQLLADIHRSLRGSKQIVSSSGNRRQRVCLQYRCSPCTPYGLVWIGTDLENLQLYH